ncbi:MAG: TetR/AcrR family transcriptional regulator [Tannerellaceae bacterium]|nr:TetR/AcrR family transcriptional regulator [Tannerellaceae bacterium]
MMKERILLTALDLFSQYGIKKVSMDDITRNISISKRTLYEFFENKEMLLVEGIEFNYNRMCALLDQLEKSLTTSWKSSFFFTKN